MNVMIDIETLGTTSYSAIVAIAAIKFNIETGVVLDVFHTPIHMGSCLSAGMKVDTDTLEWWLLRDKSTIRTVFSGAKSPMPEVLKYLQHFIERDDIVWGNSARFDLGLLENAYDTFGLEKPWNHYNERCVRTLSSLIPEVKRNAIFTGIKHRPLDDCYHQVKYVSAIWNILNSNKNIKKQQ